MKKKRWIVLLLIIFLFNINEVSAETCKTPNIDSIVNYYAGDYGHVPYCTGGRNVQDQGCFVLSMSSILASYGKSVTPEDMASFLCNNNQLKGAANTVTYGGIIRNPLFTGQYDMAVRDIPDTYSAMITALDEGKMVLASVKGPSGGGTSIFANATHYLFIATRDDKQFYVVNSSKRGAYPNGGTGWYSEDQVLKYIIGSLNNGLWSVIPNDCSNQGSSGGSHGSSSGNNPSGGMTEDLHPNIFPDLDSGTEDQCNALFLKKNGELNELGEFVADAFLLIKIAAPILVIVLSTIDYLKAIMNSNSDEIKKANQRTIKRLIIGLIIFFLPFLLDLLFHLFGLYDISKCNIIS